MIKRMELVELPAKSLVDLNTFAAVVTILEGGHLHAVSFAAADRIIKICKREQAKRLRDYDRYLAAALKDTGK